MTDQYFTPRKTRNLDNSAKNGVQHIMSSLPPPPLTVPSSQTGYLYSAGRHHQVSNSTIPSQPNMLSHHLVNLLPQQTPQTPTQSNHQTSLINMNFTAAPGPPPTQFTHQPIYQLSNAFNNTSNSNTNNNFASPRHQNNTGNRNYNKKSYNNNNNNNSHDNINNNINTSYPVRLLVNVELVGPLIGRKGEKIKEITVKTGAKIDIKRESVPYSQFGLNQYMFSGCTGAGGRNNSNGSGDNAMINNNQYLMGSNGMANSRQTGESQIVFITGEPDKCSAAVDHILQLCSQESINNEQINSGGGRREEPSLGLLVEDRFCARLIGKEGRHLNVVRSRTGCQVHVSNVPTITTLLQQQPNGNANGSTNGTGNNVISLDRIISCRGNNLSAMLEAEKMISDKVRQCVAEDNVNSSMNVNSECFVQQSRRHIPPPPPPPPHHHIPPPPVPHQHPPQPGLPAPPGPPHHHHHHLQHSSYQPAMTQPPHLSTHPNTSNIGSGIVHKANPNWPDNLKLDENLYVRIPQTCAGSIIGSEGKSVRRIMAETGTYVQVSKSNLSAIESVPAVHTYRKQNAPSNCYNEDIDGKSQNQRLVTLKGGAVNQCTALAHIFHRVRLCYSNSNNNNANHHNNNHNHNNDDNLDDYQNQELRLWIILRIPKMLLGRLIGKDGKVIRQLQHNSHAYLSFPKLIKNNSDNNANKSDVTLTGGLGEATEILDEIDATEETDKDASDVNEDHIGDLGGDSNSEGHVGIAKSNTSTGVQSESTLLNPDSAIFGDTDLHPVEIYGTHESVESAIYMIRRLIYSSIFSQYGPALIPGPMMMMGSNNQHHSFGHDMILPPVGPPSHHHHALQAAHYNPYYNSMPPLHPASHGFHPAFFNHQQPGLSSTNTNNNSNSTIMSPTALSGVPGNGSLPMPVAGPNGSSSARSGMVNHHYNNRSLYPSHMVSSNHWYSNRPNKKQHTKLSQSHNNHNNNDYNRVNRRTQSDPRSGERSKQSKLAKSTGQSDAEIGDTPTSALKNINDRAASYDNNDSDIINNQAKQVTDADELLNNEDEIQPNNSSQMYSLSSSAYFTVNNTLNNDELGEVDNTNILGVNEVIDNTERSAFISALSTQLNEDDIISSSQPSHILPPNSSSSPPSSSSSSSCHNRSLNTNNVGPPWSTSSPLPNNNINNNVFNQNSQ